MTNGFSETLKSIEPLLDSIQDYYEDNGDFNLSYIERLFIEFTLELNNKNRTKTAKMLNISIRTVRNKLNEYKTV